MINPTANSNFKCIHYLKTSHHFCCFHPPPSHYLLALLPFQHTWMAYQILYKLAPTTFLTSSNQSSHSFPLCCSHTWLFATPPKLQIYIHIYNKYVSIYTFIVPSAYRALTSGILCVRFPTPFFWNIPYQKEICRVVCPFFICVPFVHLIFVGEIG